MEDKIIRHGELVLKPVTGVDMAEAKETPNYIVAHSETGHHHVIEGSCAVLEREGHDTIVSLDNPSKVVHKKAVDRHDDIQLPAGQYRVMKKQEYDPFMKAMREVRD